MKDNNGLNSTLITFLWKPQAFYKGLGVSPNILVPFTGVLILTFLPFIITQIIQGIDQFTIPIFMNILITWLITGIGFLLFSWGMITLLYKIMRVQASAKVVFSVLMYAMLAKGYISLLLGLIQQLMISITGIEFYYIPSISVFVSICTFVMLVIFVGFGLKWAVPSSNKQFLITFITYILINILLFISLIILAAFLLSIMFQDIGEMLRGLWSIFE